MSSSFSSSYGVVQFSGLPWSVELREVEVPTIGEDDVLLKVSAVGVCGSDIHQAEGSHSWPVNYPVILGHEFSGIVAKIGKNVRSFKEGDRVVSETAAIICGECRMCKTGLYNLCPTRKGFGYGVNGAMTELVRVPARCLHRIPDTLSFEAASLTEPCCVAYNAVCSLDIKPGQSAVVLGPGPIGLLCALMANIRGCWPIVLVGIPGDETRLSFAERLGASHTFLQQNGVDLVEFLAGLTGHTLGADLVVDATGVTPSLKTAIEIVAPGGTISKPGWGKAPPNFSLDPLVQKAVQLQGSFSHNYPIWEAVIQLLTAGKIPSDVIIGHRSGLSEWRKAFEEMKSGIVIKSTLFPAML